jgi:hypothetical protein
MSITASAGRSPNSSAATQIVRRDVRPGFVAAELIVWLNEHKIIRPGSKQAASA